uniref:G-protein coupled receptors family 1 profile domain-containing protein n=1 Tax=Branchiostoma floridae TaxID=7739 RepID=C3ZHB3_BRAFL|eukprot:XP_002592085.1 hypothetical protein BRAFLDRAFT_104746 [Branchiostoma floridae]
MKHEHLHTPAYILMANLAASDVLTGIDFNIFAGCSVLYYFHTETNPSETMLRLQFTLLLLSGLSSAYSLLALTTERHWFIVHGMTYVNKVTDDKCKVVVLIVWLWSVLLAMLPNFGWHCASRAEEGCLRRIAPQLRGAHLSVRFHPDGRDRLFQPERLLVSLETRERHRCTRSRRASAENLQSPSSSSPL